jgi:hypothetical protein
MKKSGIEALTCQKLFLLALLINHRLSRSEAMPEPRKTQVLQEETPYCHSLSRCVHRTSLCRVGDFAAKSLEYRRQWIVDRLKRLANIFAIDAWSKPEFLNHYYDILHVDSACAADGVSRRLSTVGNASPRSLRLCNAIWLKRTSLR